MVLTNSQRAARTALSVATLAAVSTLSVVRANGLPDHPGQGAALCESPPSAARVRRETLPAVIEIVSWNIQKASNSGWDQDLARLGARADLVFLQEASLQAQIPQVLDGPVADSFAPGYRNRQRTTGVMTLSAARPHTHCRLSAKEPWLRTPKATSVTEFRIAGREERLLSVNLHAVNFSLGLDTLREQLADVGVLLRQHEGPVIVAGDLNTWRRARQALVDEFMLSHDLTSVDFTPDLRSTAFGRALDHIYVRGMQVRQAEVVSVDSSDHNALRAQLSLP